MTIARIARHELANNLLTLRFPLAAALIVVLFVVNAFVFSGGDYEKRLASHSVREAESRRELDRRVYALNHLATHGPGELSKRPSPLTFVAEAGEYALPVSILAEGRGGMGWGSKGFMYHWTNPWALDYPYNPGQTNSMHVGSEALDWAFIIGVVVSFICIFFTYNAISGERESGTLRLLLSYSVPRDRILIGKFLGVSASVAAPVLLGILLSLLVVIPSGALSSEPGALLRLGLCVLVSILYLSLFVWLGLLVSARSTRSSTSLLALLLIWTVVVILIPRALGPIAAELVEIPSAKAFWQERDSAVGDRSKPDDLYKSSPSENPPKPEALRRWSRYLEDGREIFTQLTDAHLGAQMAQIERGRNLMRVSPSAVFGYALENLAGTGFTRHKSFVASARRYRGEVEAFLKARDLDDRESPHSYPVKEGLSKHPVPVESIPAFEDRTSLGADLTQTVFDLSILAVLCLVLFIATYVSFLKYDPR